MVFLSEVGFPCNFISLPYAFHLWLNVIAFASASEWIIGDSLLKVNMEKNAHTYSSRQSNLTTNMLFSFFISAKYIFKLPQQFAQNKPKVLWPEELKSVVSYFFI